MDVLNQIGNCMKSDIFFLKISWNPCKLHFNLKEHTCNVIYEVHFNIYMVFWSSVKVLLSDLKYHCLNSVPVVMLSL